MTIAKLIIGSVLALLLASGCLASEALPEEWPCKSNADCLAGEKCFDPRRRRRALQARDILLVGDRLRGG